MRFARFIARLVMVLVRYGLAWVPALLILFFGALYLFRVWNWLLAPDVPVALQLPVRGTDTRVTVQRYSVDLEAGRFDAEGVTVATGGEVVLQADRVGGVRVGEAFRIEARNADALIVRRADGTLNIDDFQVDQAEPGGPQPSWILNMKRARVKYRDRAEQLGEDFLLSNVTVNRAENRSLVVADLSGTVVGQGALAGLFVDDGSGWIRARGQGWQVHRLYAVTRPYLGPNERRVTSGVDLGQIVADGPWTIAFGGTRAPSYSAALDLRGSGVTYRPWAEGAALMGRIEIAESVARTRVDVRERGRTTRFDGTVDWTRRLRYSGKAEVSIADRSRLWRDLAAALPPDARFQGLNWKGQLSGEEARVALAGQATVSQVQIAGETVRNLKGKVVADPNQLAVKLDAARALGANWAGGLSYNLRSQAVEGFAEADQISLAPLAARAGVTGLSGTARASVALTGTARSPLAELVASGVGRYRPESGEPVAVERFNARLGVRGDALVLHRFEGNLLNGSVVATGLGNWRRGEFLAQIQAGGLEVNRLVPDAAGQTFVSGDLQVGRGGWAFNGLGRVYGLTANEVRLPVVDGRILANGSRIAIEDLNARYGTASVLGQASFDLQSGALDGTLSSTETFLADFVDAEIRGRARVLAARLSGTIDDPLVTARLQFSGLGVGEISASTGSADIVVNRNEAVIRRLVANIGSGDVTGTGRYRFKDQYIESEFNLNQIPLSARAPDAPDLRVSGEVTGRLAYRGTVDEPEALQSALTLSDAQVGQDTFGAGSVRLGLEGRDVVASAQLGTIERFATISNGRWTWGSKDWRARLDVFGFEAEKLTALLRPRLQSVTPEADRVLTTLQGRILVGSELRSEDGEIIVDVDSFEASELSVLGRDAGTLTAKASRRSGVWTLGELNWTAEDTQLTAQGTLSEAENGPISLQLAAPQLDLSWLRTWNPNVRLSGGTASAFFVMDGTVQSPSGRGSLDVTGLRVTQGDAETPLDLSATVPEIALEDGRLRLSGLLNYQGLSANLTAEIPVIDPSGGTPTEGISASLVLPERNLRDTPQLVDALNLRTAEGRVSGRLDLVQRGEEWRPNLNLDITATRLGWEGQDFELLDTSVAVRADAETATLTARSRNSTGGEAAVDARADVSDLVDGRMELEEWLRSEMVQASVALRDFQAQVTLPSAAGSSGGRVTGDIAVRGSVRSPLVTGGVRVSQGVVNLPTQPLPPGEPVVYAVNPQFAGLRLEAASGTRIFAPTLTLDLMGTGTLNGSLDNPLLNWPFLVERGQLNLPAARVTLDEGGQVVFRYVGDGSGGGVASADLNLTGRTSLVAARGDGRATRYKIELGVFGNVLSANERLRLTASSDPPDLSSSEILARIGQADLIAAFASGTASSSDLGRGLLAAALPALLDEATTGLAKGLGFDYLYIDYSPLAGYTLSIGRVLDSRWTLDVTRQLTEPQFGERRYELRMTYRVPTPLASGRRLNFSYSIDQDVPWRIGVDWTRRFR